MHATITPRGLGGRAARGRAPCAGRPGRAKSVHVAAAVRARGSKQVVVSKTLRAKPAAAGAVAKTLAELLDLAEERAKSDKTCGIVSMTYVRDQWEDGVFHCYERYASNLAMRKFNTDPMVEEVIDKLSPNLDGPIGWITYEWKDGKLGAASLAEGPTGEGGLDDATGASGASGGASMKQTIGRPKHHAAVEAGIDGVAVVEQASQHAPPGPGDIAHRLQGILSGAQNNITSFLSRFSKKR